MSSGDSAARRIVCHVAIALVQRVQYYYGPTKDLSALSLLELECYILDRRHTKRLSVGLVGGDIHKASRSGLTQGCMWKHTGNARSGGRPKPSGVTAATGSELHDPGNAAWVRFGSM